MGEHNARRVNLEVAVGQPRKRKKEKKVKRRKKRDPDEPEIIVQASGEVEEAKAGALAELMKVKNLPKDKRLPQWRALLRAWHPDKNPDKVEVATAVFQFLQKGRKLINEDND